MISEAYATKQVERMAGLDHFPREKGAIRELKMALMMAATESLCDSVVTDWLGSETICPKPADLRRTLYDKNQTAGKAKCPHCEGTGYLTVFKLVTYRGRTFQVQSAEALPSNLTSDGRQAFRARLNENQDILSCAVACECLPSTDPARSGG